VDFARVKFYCPHALADGNQCIRTRENTLEFSSLLPGPSLNFLVTQWHKYYVTCGGIVCICHLLSISKEYVFVWNLYLSDCALCSDCLFRHLPRWSNKSVHLVPCFISSLCMSVFWPNYSISYVHFHQILNGAQF